MTKENIIKILDSPLWKDVARDLSSISYIGYGTLNPVYPSAKKLFFRSIFGQDNKQGFGLFRCKILYGQKFYIHHYEKTHPEKEGPDAYESILYEYIPLGVHEIRKSHKNALRYSGMCRWSKTYKTAYIDEILCLKTCPSKPDWKGSISFILMPDLYEHYKQKNVKFSKDLYAKQKLSEELRNNAQ